MSSYINKRKDNLVRIINDRRINVINSVLIKELLGDGILDTVINRIDCNRKITVLKSPLNLRGYLTGDELFINILDNFITCVINIVNSPELIKIIIINCLKNNFDILLSNRYFYDDDNINYYISNFNIMIVKIFYNNLLKMKNELLEELNNININIDKIDINNKKDVSYLVNVIEEIVFVNRNDYKILSLFTKITKSKYSIFLDQYKMLIDKYKKNMPFIKAYRDFKNNSYD